MHTDRYPYTTYIHFHTDQTVILMLKNSMKLVFRPNSTKACTEMSLFPPVCDQQCMQWLE